jgi:type I restriction enzyme S subunit
MGKPVKQDPNDEPASKLLERITAKKVQVIKAKIYQQTSKLKNKKEFFIPKHWEKV